jgi:hypothetical protein
MHKFDPPIGQEHATRCGYRDGAVFPGGVAAGPLLLPGRPCIPLESCKRVVGFIPALAVPSRVSAGPLLPPGCPEIPAPEPCVLGATGCGVGVCASAEIATIANGNDALPIKSHLQLQSVARSLSKNNR